MPEPDLQDPDGTEGELSSAEMREALRACKGMMLRQEICELDVDAFERGEHRPVKLFSAACHNCHIRLLQRKYDDSHAVFLVTESEAISYHYELDLPIVDAQTDNDDSRRQLRPDPRVTHSLNLRLDEYGQVLQSVAAVYPRTGRHSDELLPEGVEALIAQVQTEHHLVYTENHYTNDVGSSDLDNYRLRLPSEIKTYEVTGILPSQFYFSLEDLRGELPDFRSARNNQTGRPPLPDRSYHELEDLNQPARAKRLMEHVRMLFFDRDLREPLALGELNAQGLLYETYTLALTDALLEAVFGDKLTGGEREDLDNPAKSGYLSGAILDTRFPGSDNAGQYWIRSGIAGFDDGAANRFYLPDRYIDPFDNITEIEYDKPTLLFPTAVTDPVGNRTEVATFDYRVLAPESIRDINGNVSELVYNIIGLPAAMALRGKADDGDRLDTFRQEPTLVDLDMNRIIGIFTTDYTESTASELLGDATARFVYSFGETGSATEPVYGQHPPCAAAILRETHVADLATNERSRLQTAFEYSDGQGSALVKKAQAEPEEPGAEMRWIANGMTILNNKGKPVKQYEPFFTPTHQFGLPEERGVATLIYYDAPGRVIRTDMPDGSYSRVSFTPWHVVSHDQNDTVGEPGNAWYSAMMRLTATVEERRAARLALGHADTPAETFLDSLGREVISVVHNRADPPNGDLPDEKYVTFTRLDAEGKPLWIRDDRRNLVMQYIDLPDVLVQLM